MQAKKDERFRSELKKEAIFCCFNFNMVNIGSIRLYLIFRLNLFTKQMGL